MKKVENKAVVFNGGLSGIRNESFIFHACDKCSFVTGAKLEKDPGFLKQQIH